MSETIFKIINRDDWSQAVSFGVFKGSKDDLRDGFIHFSTAEQLAGTLDKHFKGKGNLMLVGFIAAQLGSELKWERSRNDDLFPHLYGDLDPAKAVYQQPLKQLANGGYQIPELPHP